jgi:hypothetical protein
MASKSQQSDQGNNPYSLDEQILGDRVYAALQGAVQFVVEFSNTLDRSDALVSELGSYEKTLTGNAPDEKGDGDSSDTKVSALLRPAYNQLTLSLAQADADFKTAEGKAASALLIAVTQWGTAVQQYQFAVLNARAAVDVAITPAVDQRKVAQDRADSVSRSQVLFYALEVTCDTALGAYVTAYNGAGVTLAAAAGVLLAAYVTYVGAVNTAGAARTLAYANAKSKRWQAVEASRDS